MRITYLKLVNFKNVLSALNRHILEIDLSKSMNRVVIILGENGSGKTTIMSQLHPFANNGNTDQRHIKELLIEGKEAYKEIHLQDGHDKYVVKHFYSKSGSVKSYIEKNGVELNPNGNVTSFLECLYDELTLATDFLNLLRLGSNDSNFIKMSATERKKYTTSLLDDIKIYEKLFKKVSEDLRVLKSLLKGTAEKINKLKVYSIKDLENEIKELEQTLSAYITTKDELISTRAVLQSTIQNLLQDKTIYELSKTLNEAKEELRHLIKKLSKLESIDKVELLKSEFDQYWKKFTKCENELERIQNEISDLLSRKTEYANTIDKFSIQLGSFNADEIERTENLIKDYKTRLDTEFKGYDNTKSKYSSQDLKDALELLKNIDNVCSLMLGFNNKAKKEIVNLYLEEPNVNHESAIHKMHASLQNKLEKAKISKQNQMYRDKVDTSDMRFMYKPAGCQYTNCPMELFYQDITNTKSFDSKEIDKTIRKLEQEIEELDDYYAINSNIQYIKMIIESNAKLIERIPPDIVDFTNILHAIVTETPCYDETYITKMINIADKHALYTELKERVKELEDKLHMMKENSGAMALLQKEIESNRKKLKEIDKQIEVLKERKEHTTATYETLKTKVNELEELIKLSEEKADLQKRYEEVQQQIEKLTQDIQKVEVSHSQLKNIEGKIKEVDYKIRHYSDLLETSKRNLVMYKELMEEKEQLEEKFEDLSTIREALSSTKGIPLLYMRVYMMDSLSQINELLDIVYDGTLEVQPFQIDEDSFKIPYTKNGIYIPDVRSCSQGEETFLSMAISFAFISRSIERYNIMLLDEIDAALDQRRRQSFLDTLEAQLNIINAEQVFMITHNNAFYDYPVDAILTSDYNIDSYKNINVIFDATKS